MNYLLQQGIQQWRERRWFSPRETDPRRCLFPRHRTPFHRAEGCLSRRNGCSEYDRMSGDGPRCFCEVKIGRGESGTV